MSSVEICCTAADRSRLDWLAYALAERGWVCGWSIDRAPRPDARCAIVVWTDAMRTTPWLKGIARAAHRRGILVSATMDHVKAPRGLRGRARVDLSAWPAKSADRAIDELLDGVAFVMANPEAVKERDSDLGDKAIVASVAAVFVGVLFWLISTQRDVATQSHGPVASTDQEPTVREAPVASNVRRAPAATAPATESTMPPAEAAAALGRQAIDELGAVLDGDHASAERAQSSARTALRLDPTEPNARIAHALCSALLGGAWEDAARSIAATSPASLSPAAADLAARWYLLHGDVQEAGKVIDGAAVGDRSWDVGAVITKLAPRLDTRAETPLCELLDDTRSAQAADAYRALTPGERLALLGEPCFLARAAASETVRTWLGIGI